MDRVILLHKQPNTFLNHRFILYYLLFIFLIYNTNGYLSMDGWIDTVDRLIFYHHLLTIKSV